MSTAKHYSFCSGPMDYQSVTDLPGIGSTYGSRLNRAGFYMAKDIYEKFKSYNFDSGRCQGWLNSVCDANSRYSSMCYQALREWHEQFGEHSYSPNQKKHQPYRNETPEFGFLKKEPLLQSPERALHSPWQQSSPSNKGSDISKAEVMQMMAEFRNKQDAMATQIKKMEQEKSKTDNYIKTLETKIDLISKNAVELQKRHDTKIATLTNKLSVIDRTEQYKNISSSIYLLTQKFDDIIIELKEAKDKSTIHCYVKALETRIKQIDKNAKKLQKQHDKISSALTNKITGTNNLDQYKEVSSSINLLAQKFDIFIKQQSGPNQDKKSSSQKVLDAEIKQVEHDLSNLTVGIRNVTKNNTETKEELPNSDKHPIEIPNVGKNHITLMKKTINHLKLTDFPKVVLKDKIVEL